MSNTKKKCFSESYGAYGSTIRLAELKPGGMLNLVFFDKLGRLRKRSLGHRDRQRARKEAREMAARLAVMARGVVVSKPLTIAEGVSRAFDPVHGMYPVQTEHVKQARTLLRQAAGILGEDLTWADLTPGRIQTLVRTMARASVQGRGARKAEYTCAMVYAVANWLRQEELIPETAALAKRNWKARLKEEWEAITGVRLEPKRPRHTAEEVARIFEALPRVDPRLRLLLELAAELRVGQAVRARRSDLTLEPIGGFGLGRFVVGGRGKKRGEVVDLHPELRALVDEVLDSGYLSEAESAFRRGAVGDFYLFPAGRLKDGRASVEQGCWKHLWPTAIRDMFIALENAAGVEHRPGRSFYGLRRQATDLAPEFETDGRVLNHLTGHVTSEMREKTYQDPQNDRVLARAAVARRNMRRSFLAGDGIPRLKVV